MHKRQSSLTSPTIKIVKEEAFQLSCNLRPYFFFLPGLELLKQIIVCDHRAADASQYFSVNLHIVIYRDDHKQRCPDSLEIRIFKAPASAGRTADNDRFLHCLALAM